MRPNKAKEKKPYPNGDAELPQGCSGAPQIHAAIQEVNKLKERQKEGGWPLINRRSHALRLSSPTYECQCSSFGPFFVFIGWDPDGQVPAGPADLELGTVRACVPACVHMIDIPLFLLYIGHIPVKTTLGWVMGLVSGMREKEVTTAGS